MTLASPDDMPSAEERQAAEELAAANKDLAWELTKAGFDVAGIVDPTPVSDLASGAMSLWEGDLIGAGLSLISLIPYAGDALAKTSKGARVTKKVAQLRGKVAGLVAKIGKMKAAREAKTAERTAAKAVREIEAAEKSAAKAAPSACASCAAAASGHGAGAAGGSGVAKPRPKKPAKNLALRPSWKTKIKSLPKQVRRQILKKHDAVQAEVETELMKDYVALRKSGHKNFVSKSDAELARDAKNDARKITDSFDWTQPDKIVVRRDYGPGSQFHRVMSDSAPAAPGRFTSPGNMPAGGKAGVTPEQLQDKRALPDIGKYRNEATHRQNYELTGPAVVVEGPTDGGRWVTNNLAPGRDLKGGDTQSVVVSGLSHLTPAGTKQPVQ